MGAIASRRLRSRIALRCPKCFISALMPGSGVVGSFLRWVDCISSGGEEVAGLNRLRGGGAAGSSSDTKSICRT